ncbi:MAG: SpoIIE family protein phosphatase [bacterium]|nr:SpoIIE family protein phosphatase [bacterium]
MKGDDSTGVSSVDSEKLVFLVVEDDATNQMLLRRALGRMGYEVLLAIDGETGIRLFEEHQIDMVLMDLELPGMDGYEATARIKEMSGDDFVPVIILTGATDDAELARCVEVGGDDFLTKPCSPVVLGARIDALCRIRSLHREKKQQHDLVSQHQARLIREQEVAERLFSSMLNRDGATSDVVKCMVSPASIFNGDVVLHAETPSGGVRVLVGDFTGHGLQAAIGALPVTDIFRSMTDKGFTITDVVRELNQKLCTILPTRMFFACALLELDPEYDRLLLWNGGMPDVIVMEQGGVIRKRLVAKHVALGIQSNDRLDPTPEDIPIEVGERVYLVSDGILEATNAASEMFSQERLEAFLSANVASEDLFEELGEMLLEFTGHTEQDDDFTLVEVRHQGRSHAEGSSSAPKVARVPLHWCVELCFDADALREVDPLPLLMQLTIDLQGLQEHSERIYMLLAELFFNSLDHGILGLDSGLKESPQGFSEYYSQRAKRLSDLREGRIAIALRHEARSEGGCLHISVEDTGRGFDFEQHTRSMANNLTKSGRGLALIHNIAEQIAYSKGGTRVDVAYVWHHSQPD